jgi:hypothetical protein
MDCIIPSHPFIFLKGESKDIKIPPINIGFFSIAANRSQFRQEHFFVFLLGSSINKD